MRTTLTFLTLIFFISCDSASSKVQKDKEQLEAKINAYTKAKANKPDTYQSKLISDKELVTDTNIIKECYYEKYAPKVIEFGEKETFNSPVSAEIKEKFYQVSNSFDAENRLGQKKSGMVIIYLDSTDKIISATTLF